MKVRTECPICHNSQFENGIKLKDYMITREEFHIVACAACGFHFTHPIPFEKEIGRYYKSEAYVSHSSSKKGVINFIYGIVRRVTLKQKVKWVKSVTKGTDLLDVGCGTGHFLQIAKSSGFNATGIEPDEDARSFAIEENGVMCLPQDKLYDLPGGGYDVISMWHVLEHVYDLERDLAVMAKLLRKNGKFLIAVPNMASYDAQRYGVFWAAYDVPRHLYHFQEKDIIRLMERFGFELEKIYPMKFDAYYVSMLSEKYKGGSLFSALVMGWKSNRVAKTHGYSSQVYVFQRSGIDSLGAEV